MKTIVYSEVPQTPNYVHLAYLSAASVAPDSLISTAMLMGLVSLLAVAVGSRFKKGITMSPAWRLVVIALVAVTLCLLFAAMFTLPAARTRSL